MDDIVKPLTVDRWSILGIRSWIGKRRRVNSPPMLLKGLRSHLFMGSLVLCIPMFAQQDTTAFGGPEDGLLLDEYEEEESAAADELEMGAREVWSAADSLFHIPSHALYGHWNNDVIFPNKGSITDTVHIHLSHAACDHEMPICGRITSTFGPRGGRMHYGVDIKLQTGDPVLSAFEGLVRISKFHRQFGHVVVVRHANGLETLYAHLNERKVHVGQSVQAGELLGLGGNTGRSTGAHLHFEVRYLGRPIDPQLVFNVEEGELHANTLMLHTGTFAAVERARAAVQAARYHKVRSGETLSAIGRRYGVSVAKLCSLNRMKSTSTLRVGQRVRYR